MPPDPPSSMLCVLWGNPFQINPPFEWPSFKIASDASVKCAQRHLSKSISINVNKLYLIMGGQWLISMNLSPQTL